MDKKKIFFIFIGIAMPILLFGFIGVYYSVNRIHRQYIDMQLESNQQNAILIAKLFDQRIAAGETEDDLIRDFQVAVTGSQTDKGYLCIFDREKGVLLGHPNPQAVGMDIKSDNLTFDNSDGRSRTLLYDAVSSEGSESGIMHFAEPERSEIVYMTAVNGTNWKLSVHENLQLVEKQLSSLQNAALGGFFVLAVFISFLSTYIVYRISKRHKKEIAEKDRQIEKQKAQLSVFY